MTGEVRGRALPLSLSLSQLGFSTSKEDPQPPSYKAQIGRKGGDGRIVLVADNAVIGKTFTIGGAYRDSREVGRTNRRLGALAEKLVNEALRAWLPLAVTVRRLEMGPDFEVASAFGRVTIEVKASISAEKLRRRIEEAFEKGADLAIGIQWGKGAWIYTAPSKRHKFTKRNLERVLRKLGVI